MTPPSRQPHGPSRLLTLRPGDSAGVEDFVGPIDVAWVPGKGRGILVQRDVPQGAATMMATRTSHTSCHRS